MVRYNNILRAIEYDLNKSYPTALAERIGKTAKWESLANDGDVMNEYHSKVSYDDGTVAYFNGYKELVHLKTRNDVEISIIGGEKESHNKRVDSVERMFKNQSKRIRKQLEKDSYEFFVEYSNVLNSNAFEMIMNVAEKDNWTEKDKMDSIHMLIGGEEAYDFLNEGRTVYNGILRDLDLNGYGNFYSVDIKTERREMGETNWTTVNKDHRIYTNDWTNSACLTNTEPSYWDGKPPHPFADEGNHYWTEVTIYEDGNSANKGWVYCDNNEGFVKSGIGQKFKRQIIDERNHLIFQYPYKSLRKTG